MLTSPFCFATCQHGAERALKDEIAREHPELHPAFQRPGLVTFKSPTPLRPEHRLRAVFARRQGMALGPLDEHTIPDGAILHVFPRDPARPDELDEVWARAAAHAETEAARLGATQAAARPGDLVADVITAPGEPTFLGVHRHLRGEAPLPGATWPLTPLPDAPARAWRKIEEMILWSGADVRRGQQVLEVGCSPGGASLALLRRGLRVTGLDPQPMDPRVLANPAFTWIQAPVAAVNDALPARVDWLVVDASMAPQKILRSIRRFGPKYRKTLHGAFITLKLNDWRFSHQIPGFLELIRELGLPTVRAVQLPAHRQEIGVFAAR